MEIVEGHIQKTFAIRRLWINSRVGMRHAGRRGVRAIFWQRAGIDPSVKFDQIVVYYDDDRTQTFAADKVQGWERAPLYRQTEKPPAERRA